jgi:hypothetical protein
MNRGDQLPGNEVAFAVDDHRHQLLASGFPVRPAVPGVAAGHAPFRDSHEILQVWRLLDGSDDTQRATPSVSAGAVIGSVARGLSAGRFAVGDSGQTVGTHTDQLEGVLDIGEPGIGGQPFRPPLDDVGVDSPAEAAASADQVMAVAGRRPLTVNPATRLVPYDVDAVGPLEIVQRAIHRGQADGHPSRTQQGMQFTRGHEVPATRQRLQDRGTLTRPSPADVGWAQPVRTFHG